MFKDVFSMFRDYPAMITASFFWSIAYRPPQNKIMYVKKSNVIVTFRCVFLDIMSEITVFNLLEIGSNVMKKNPPYKHK